MTSRTLSEHASKELLVEYGIPVARETLADDPAAAVRAAEALGFPVVVKLCGDKIAHKTERNLVRLGLTDGSGVEAAAEELLGRRWPDHGLFGHGPNRLYVHRGTGFYGFPLRVGVPGEASVLEVVLDGRV